MHTDKKAKPVRAMFQTVFFGEALNSQNNWRQQGGRHDPERGKSTTNSNEPKENISQGDKSLKLTKDFFLN